MKELEFEWMFLFDSCNFQKENK